MTGINIIGIHLLDGLIQDGFSKIKTSVSWLVESYLDVVTKQSKPENEITPLVKSLSGVIDDDINFNQ